MTHRVHGMDGGLTEPVWPPLTPVEVAEVLSRYPGGHESVSVSWSSPRPMSAAALIDLGDRRLFVKRHSPEVRSAARLRGEHRFAGWQRDHGVVIPLVLRTESGDTVVETAGGLYEVSEAAPGVDRYRQALSWTTYRSFDDAFAAGRALALFHVAATSFDGEPHPIGPLTVSSALVTAPEPLSAIFEHIQSRPVLARYLDGRDWRRELEAALEPALERGRAAGLDQAASLWGHGDWHPSNLTWDESGVVAVLDLGLSNRTFAMHDLAVAVERGCVNWLGSGDVDRPSLEGLLQGYRSIRPWGPDDRTHLMASLPLAHIDYALSEVEYFAGVARSPADAELAYRGYLCGHAAGEAWAAVERIGQNMP